jgi:(2R)-sulfolactate sulfo-lyase subunit alpha
MIHFVLHDAKDTVAVAVVEGITAGIDATAWIMDEDREIHVKTAQDIPIGHKVALADMAVGDTVIKYGIDIGRVVAPIKKGEHAHVQNIKTKRW